MTAPATFRKSDAKRLAQAVAEAHGVDACEIEVRIGQGGTTIIARPIGKQAEKPKNTWDGVG